MDRLQRQSSQKDFHQNKDQNRSWNENCDKDAPLSKFAKLSSWLDGVADIPYLNATDGVEDAEPKLQSEYQEPEQRNSQQADSSLINESIENPEFSTCCNASQLENSLEDLPLAGLTNEELHVLEAEKEEIANQSLNVVSEEDLKKLSISNYIQTFLDNLYGQNEMLSFCSSVYREERTATPADNRDAVFNKKINTSESTETIVEEALRFLNIPVSKKYSGSCDQSCEEGFEEQNQSSSSAVVSPDCGKRADELENKNDLFNLNVTVNFDSYANEHLRNGEFVCPLCRKSFCRKDSFIIHHRNHTGEKPFRCVNCEKRFVTNGHLTKHMVTHIQNKPFGCHVCDKRFARKSDLTRHLRSHRRKK